MTDCSVSLTLQNRSPGRDISLYCLCSLFHISYLSLLLCIWCRDMHFLDNDQPINPHLSKRKWDNHHVAWYYWEGRLDLLKTGGILWLLLCSVNTERDRLKRLLNKKSHFKSLGKQVPFRSELCIRMQWKRKISINSASFFKKNPTTKTMLSAALHQPFLPACFLLSTHLVPGSAIRDEPVTWGHPSAEASSHSCTGSSGLGMIYAGWRMAPRGLSLAQKGFLSAVLGFLFGFLRWQRSLVKFGPVSKIGGCSWRGCQRLSGLFWIKSWILWLRETGWLLTEKNLWVF